VHATVNSASTSIDARSRRPGMENLQRFRAIGAPRHPFLP
jgi:hypothetical protein